MARILQASVPPLFPPEGPVDIMLFGEAPGPLGADKSGIPFWGDRAGLQVYRAMEACGRAKVPADAYLEWDGARFRQLALEPVLAGIALSNAYPVCPTKDGHSFRAPTDRELKSLQNLERLESELQTAQGRCPGQLRVVAMGRRAAWVLNHVRGSSSASFTFDLFEVPHPSAQGLLQAAPGKGKGLKLADLKIAWESRLRELLVTGMPSKG